MLGEFSYNKFVLFKAKRKFVSSSTAAAFTLCIILVLQTYGLASNAEQYLNPEWIEPHAWAAEKDPLQRLCPQVTTCDKECDKRNLEIAFKKLVHNFFAPDKFKVCGRLYYYYMLFYLKTSSIISAG